MKKLSIVTGIIAVLMSTTAAPQDVTITTGREGGSYFGVQGPKIVKFVK